MSNLTRFLFQVFALTLFVLLLCCGTLSISAMPLTEARVNLVFSMLSVCVIVGLAAVYRIVHYGE